MTSELTAQAETVFFGIMIGDMFEFVDPDENIDVDASIAKYASLCVDAIVEGFAEHGEAVTVDWDSQNVGGVVPYGLKTKVNGETDHNDVQFVDDIVTEVWSECKWIVKELAPDMEDAVLVAEAIKANAQRNINTDSTVYDTILGGGWF